MYMGSKPLAVLPRQVNFYWPSAEKLRKPLLCHEVGIAAGGSQGYDVQEPDPLRSYGYRAPIGDDGAAPIKRLSEAWKAHKCRQAQREAESEEEGSACPCGSRGTLQEETPPGIEPNGASCCLCLIRNAGYVVYSSRE